MMSRTTPAVTLAFLLGLLPLCATALSTAPLGGVRQVALLFEGDLDLAAREGLDLNGLREEIGRRLQAAGIEVVGPAEAGRSGRDRLVVKLQITPTAVTYGYTITVRLERRQALPEGGGWLKQTVWSDWKVGGTRLGELERMRPWILELVEDFLSAWRRAGAGGAATAR